MKRSNTALILALICMSWAGYSSGQGGTIRQDFDTDLGDMITNRGFWHQSNRDDIGWWVPEGAEGFAVLSNQGEGDELYDENVDVAFGLTYEIRFFFASQYIDSTTFQVQQLNLDGSLIRIIDDYTHLSTPDNSEWITVTGSLEATNLTSRAGVFCQSSELNEPGQPLWGCAVDYMLITASGSGPATTSPPDTTTAKPTTVRQTTENAPESTTTEEPESTTTEQPSATTSGPDRTTTTPQLPGGVIEWNFNNDTAGWTLGRSNGAAWIRTSSSIDGIPDNERFESALKVNPTDIYSGTVLAMSPRLTVGFTGSVIVLAEFFVNASADYPVYLKIRRRLSYTQYDDEPMLNLDAFGNQVNQRWLLHLTTTDNLTPGEEFNLVIEASLGIDNQQSQIYVSTVVVSGVTQIPYEEEDFFDFSQGLVGWQAGSVDGGKWIVYPYNLLNPGLGIPQPSSGDLLLVERFDIHSGIISLESPPIPVSPMTAKRIDLVFWIRGSPDYPVLLRLTLKTLDGFYDDEPFLDLSEYGDSNMLQWAELETSHAVPASPRQDFFQIVIEVDLGADIENLIAIDNISLITIR